MLADIICFCKMTSLVRRCNAVFTLEIRYKYMYTYATYSNYWRELFSAMAESWKKLKTSNVFSSFIVC